MAKQRFINTRFWSDGYIDRLDPSEKLMFLYLLTNERTTISGAYELPSKIMAVETGFDKSMVDKILSRFVSDGKILHEDGWIVVINAHKHQNLANPKIRSGVNRELSILPLRIKKLLENSISNNNLSITNQDLSHLDSDLDSDLYSEERSKEISERSSHELQTNTKPMTYEEPSIDIDTGELTQVTKQDVRRVKDKEAIYQLFSNTKQPWMFHKQQREAALRLFDLKGLEQVQRAVAFMKQNSDDKFCPKAQTPFRLEEKWDALLAYRNRV